MARIVTAAFHDRETAERARAGLQRLGARHVHLHEARHAPPPRATRGSVGGEGGMPALLDALFLSREDFGAHREAVLRGGIVVSAEVEDRRASDAVRLLDAIGARDLDDEAEAWRAEGWSPAVMAGAVTACFGEVAVTMPGTGGLDAEAMRMIVFGSYAANTTGATPPVPPGGTRDPRRLLRRDPPTGRARSYAIEVPRAEDRDPARPGQASERGAG